MIDQKKKLIGTFSAAVFVSASVGVVLGQDEFDYYIDETFPTLEIYGSDSLNEDYQISRYCQRNSAQELCSIVRDLRRNGLPDRGPSILDTNYLRFRS